MAKFYYGGQAVLEGVMMRGRRSLAVAMRKPEGDIYVYEETLNPKIFQSALFRLPFLRGMLLLWEMLVIGMRMMTLSANITSGALTPEEMEKQKSPEPTGADTEQKVTTGGSQTEEERPAVIGGWSLILMVLFSISLAIGIFFVAPLVATSLLQPLIGDGWLNLTLEGVFRLALLIGYMALIGRMEDIKRVFGYHGAEHKAINAMEHGDPLDIEHVRKASRVHTRCGTGFMLLVVVVSIFVFALVDTPYLPLKFVSRILLVPIIAGIAYELMRLGAANYRFLIVRWLLAPGLALQGLTTREPDDSMIECAIAALQCVLARDAEAVSSPSNQKKDIASQGSSLTLTP